MPTSSDEDDELLGIGLPAFKKNSSRVANRTENTMFSFLDRCVAEEEERSSSRIKIQKLMKEEEVASDSIIQTKSNNIEIAKEDDYWERVHQETAKSTTSAKARRRRQLEDAIDGIVVSCGENEDDEGYWRDRAKRLGKASAITTALSTKLGTRRVFHREDIHVPTGLLEQHLTDFLPFDSEKEAIKAMDTVLSQISPKNRSKKYPVSKLIELIRCSISSKNLSNLLLCSTISRWSIKYKTKVPLPVQSWLWRVLSSSSVEMAEGSMLTLRGIMCSRITDSSGCHSGGYGLISIQQINLMMKYIFGFYVTKDTKITSRGIETSKAQTVGAARLPLMLDVWNAALQNDAVSISPQSNERTDKAHKDRLSDEVSDLLGTLILATIDPSFHTGARGMSSLQQLILTVFNVVQKYLCIGVGSNGTDYTWETKKSMEKRDQSDIWLTHLVKNVLMQAQELKEGDKGSSDMDDFNGHLPLSLMAKSIPISAPKLRAKFSEEALKTLCKNEKDLIDKRTELVAKRCKELQILEDEFSLSWQLLALAEAGLAWTGEMIASLDGPQLHAIIDTAKVCAESGRALSDLGNSCGSGIYKSTETAAFACLSYEALENYCNQIKKGITCVFVNQHLRRSKELLTQISIYSKHMKIEAMKATGKHHCLKVQATLESWIDCEDKEEELPGLT